MWLPMTRGRRGGRDRGAGEIGSPAIQGWTRNAKRDLVLGTVVAKLTLVPKFDTLNTYWATNTKGNKLNTISFFYNI